MLLESVVVCHDCRKMENPQVNQLQGLSLSTIELKTIRQELPRVCPLRPDQQAFRRYGGSGRFVVEEDNSSTWWTCGAHYHVMIRCRCLVTAQYLQVSSICTNGPVLLAAGFQNADVAVQWWGGRKLKISFG